MHSLAFRNSLLLLATVACGSPSPLDLERFPSRAETGYGGSRGGQVGAAGTPAGGGTAGTASAGGTAGGAGGTGGMGTDLPIGGTAPDNGGSAGTQDVGGTAGTDVQGGGTGGAGGGSMDEVCDALPLFARPGAEGGCGDFMCHGGLIPPDLVSPGVADRLLGVASTCNDRPYVSAGDSFIIEKLSPEPECGGQMPLGQSISDADRDCMIEWFDAVAGGG